MDRIGFITVSASMALAATACGGRETRTPAQERVTTTSAALTAAPVVPVAMAAPAAPPKVTSASALVRVTAARCDREATCHGSHGDRDRCMNEVGHAVDGELPADACPFVAPDRLDACVHAIGARGCGDDAVDVLPACTREQLCSNASHP